MAIQAEHKTQPIRQNRVRNESYVRNSHFASVEVGIKPEDVLKVDFWAHVAATFKLMDSVKVVCDDFSWYGEYIVTDVGRVHARLVPVNVKTFGDEVLPLEQEEPFEVKWQGPVNRFAVIRKSDRSMLRNELQTKEDAAEWIREYQKALSK